MVKIVCDDVERELGYALFNDMATSNITTSIQLKSIQNFIKWADIHTHTREAHQTL